METVTEAVLEQKVDDLAARFDRAESRNLREHGEMEERNRDEHEVIRADIRALRTETNAGFRELNRTMIYGFASIVASVLGSVGAVIVGHIL